jgi:hypothetical protein
MAFQAMSPTGFQPVESNPNQPSKAATLVAAFFTPSKTAS